MRVHGWAEHTVNAGYYPLEAQLMHIPVGEEPNPATISKGLVISVFLSAGTQFNRIVAAIQSSSGASYVLGAE